MDQLRSALERTRSGHGEVVAVMGEPGVGKSRLFYELTHSHRVAGCLTLHASSVSYGRATAYLPVIDRLKGYLRIDERDDTRSIRAKVIGHLLALDEALKDLVAPVLWILNALPEEDSFRRLEPTQRRQRTLDALKRLLLRESLVQPLVLVFEDLHWIDGETQALLDGLVESLPTLRVLLLVNYRPEYSHGWSHKTYYRHLRIDPLPPESAQELCQTLVGDGAEVAPLKWRLIEATEGNPLFLEESVRTLVEIGALAGERGSYRLTRAVDHPQIPATVQAILAARIDRLPPEDKRLLQAAAVIGHDVPMPLLLAIAETPEEGVRVGLARLQAAEFIYETRLFPDLEYTFKHALTHEVAYGSVLLDRRRTVHARIFEALERLGADRVAEQVEQLAHHAFKGEVWGLALQYLRQAGTKAADRYALREADTWFDQALSALTHLQKTSATLQQAADIRLERHLVLTPLGDYRVVRENLGEAERVIEQLGDERRRGQVYRAKVNVHSHLGQLDEALTWGARALEIADRLGDLTLRRNTTTMLEQTHYYRGEFERVIDLARANLSALPADGVAARLGGQPPTSVYDRGWLVRSLVELGRLVEATEPAEAAIQIAERTQHPWATGWAYMCAGILHSCQGHWATARSLYERAIEVFRGAGELVSSSHSRLEWSSFWRRSISTGAKLRA